MKTAGAEHQEIRPISQVFEQDDFGADCGGPKSNHDGRPGKLQRHVGHGTVLQISIKQKFAFILLLSIKRKCAFILSMSQSAPERWIELLSDEDRTFVKRFVLTSGSLKELAAAYGVTYPTVRLRLDRLIEKIKVFDKNDTADDYDRLLRGLYAEGRYDASTFHQLLKHYQQE